jgi:hypothetical protein
VLDDGKPECVNVSNHNANVVPSSSASLSLIGNCSGTRSGARYPRCVPYHIVAGFDTFHPIILTDLNEPFT